ncbi:MAG: TetR/AcrR family transcriptional regulator [Afipia sp.]|uniref:TetR/AcrR family transcriptional regulator n=1 Tax=Parvibaculum sp. TaxID=2024848 RepID=UPI0027308C4B|nr:TetR/AcrR family transcriptional regulator [Parvibaculum sp.]MDP2149562.1 TetR/AcrR family transcriptional regulator [Parvibaculum sp.]MDZ4365996.1 TetR/AcrR family transcriptional regulator [Afipia sp.]
MPSIPGRNNDRESASKRSTYRHGNIRREAVVVACRMIAREGHEKLSLRQVAADIGVAHRSLYNYFPDRQALLDCVAAEAFSKLAVRLKRTSNMIEFTRMYARFALKNPMIYGLMTSRPHATLKEKPELQKAVHQVITEAMRVSAGQQTDPVARRRTVMKNFILMHGGISLFASGILDFANENALINELSEMLVAP